MGIGFYVLSSRGYLWVPPMEDSIVNARDTAFEAENRQKVRTLKL